MSAFKRRKVSKVLLSVKTNVALGILTLLGLGVTAIAAPRFVQIPITGSISQPVYATQDPSSPTQLWIVEKTGKVRSVAATGGASSVILDMSRVPGFASGGEQGLLGLAVDPEFATNKWVYFYQSSTGQPHGAASLLVRYTFDSATGMFDPQSRVLAYLIPQESFSNHKGGMIEFGPDGHLYVGTGDGGSGGDPNNNGQNLNSLLGKMLRFKVEAGVLTVPETNPFVGQAGAKPEIWAYGLRNPWRFSFDREGGALWAGDVGQNRFEEIDLIQRGGNYGWRLFEGFDEYNNPGSQMPPDYVAPHFTYGRDRGGSIVGGYVYRGTELPELAGAYVFGDYGSSVIWTLRSGALTELARISGLVSFGETSKGELLAISVMGKIYRLQQ